MNSNPSRHGGGKPPIRLYLRLRQFHAQINTLELNPSLSERQRAARLGVPASSYRNLAKIYHEISAEAWASASLGDWSLVEKAVFKNQWGDITLLPSYRKAFRGDNPRRRVRRRTRKQSRRTHWLLKLLKACVRFLR